MLSRVNTEHEVRLLTDMRGLAAAERWLAAQDYQLRGTSQTQRSHWYYDLPEARLAKRNASFRQVAGKYAYCLKYPVRTEGYVITRREVFCKLPDGPLDMFHPFHQRLGILVRLFPMLSQRGLPTKALLKSFKPRIRIDCQRKLRIILYPDGIDRMLAVAFDTVSAYDLGTQREVPFASWCEVELETVWAFPERTDVALEIAQNLESEGLRVTQNSKYRIARERLARRRF